MIVRLQHLIIIAAALMISIPSAFADEAQDALVEQGVTAYNDGNYERAKSILLPLAEAGHPKAMNMIGRLHDGTGVLPDDPKIECDWYEKSAKMGYLSAQENLAICLYWGDGRTKDIEASIMWSHKAAEQGGKKAQASLAGYYVDTNRDQYLYWAQKAAAQGSTKAKALMWGNGDRDLVPDLHWTDLVCVVLMTGWIGKKSDYCD